MIPAKIAAKMFAKGQKACETQEKLDMQIIDDFVGGE